MRGDSEKRSWLVAQPGCPDIITSARLPCGWVTVGGGAAGDLISATAGLKADLRDVSRDKKRGQARATGTRTRPKRKRCPGEATETQAEAKFLLKLAEAYPFASRNSNC